jgi:hypothetical protein
MSHPKLAGDHVELSRGADGGGGFVKLLSEHGFSFGNKSRRKRARTIFRQSSATGQNGLAQIQILGDYRSA